MTTKIRTVAETLRDCIERSQSIYIVAKEAGVDYGTLHRFVHRDRDLRLSVAQRLVDYFGLELRPRVAQRRKRK